MHSQVDVTPFEIVVTKRPSKGTFDENIYCDQPRALRKILYMFRFKPRSFLLSLERRTPRDIYTAVELPIG